MQWFMVAQHRKKKLNQDKILLESVIEYWADWEQILLFCCRKATSVDKNNACLNLDIPGG